jgi:hypothetical protein
MGAVADRAAQGDPPHGGHRTVRPGGRDHPLFDAHLLRPEARRHPAQAPPASPRRHRACLSRVPGKPACTVLRGPGRSNAPRLPDNTAADHVAVLSEAVAQLPAAYRRKIIFRADGAGSTKELLVWINGGRPPRVHLALQRRVRRDRGGP